MQIADTPRPLNRAVAMIAGELNNKGGTPTLSTNQKPKLLEQVRQAIRTRHYSPKTEESYVHWIEQIHLLS